MYISVFGVLNKLSTCHISYYLSVCLCVILGCDRFCLFQWLSLGFVKIASFISSPQKTVAKIMCFLFALCTCSIVCGDSFIPTICMNEIARSSTVELETLSYLKHCIMIFYAAHS